MPTIADIDTLLRCCTVMLANACVMAKNKTLIKCYKTGTFLMFP